MPIWLSITIAVIGAVVGIAGIVIGILGLNAYSAERQKHKAQKKNEAEDKAEAEQKANEQKLIEMAEKEQMDKMVNALVERLKPLIVESVNNAVEEAVAPMKNDLKLLKAGVQDGCRNDLEQMVAKADSQKWLSRYDKDRFEHTYDSYHNLGKNGIMDSSRERILKLPERPPAKKSRK